MHNDPGWDRRALPLARKRRGPADAGGRRWICRWKAGTMPPARAKSISSTRARLHGMQAASAGCALPGVCLSAVLAAVRRKRCGRGRLPAPAGNPPRRVPTTPLPPAAARPAAVLLAQAACPGRRPVARGGAGAQSAAAAVCRRAVPQRARRAPRRGPDGADPLRRIAGYLQQHCAEPLTLERMGAEFHMSPKYFSAWFQKHFARTFSDYLTAVRIERAKTLLQQNRRRHRVGFPAGGFFGQQLFYPRFPPRCRLHPRAIPPPVPGRPELRVQSLFQEFRVQSLELRYGGAAAQPPLILCKLLGGFKCGRFLLTQDGFYVIQYLA